MARILGELEDAEEDYLDEYTIGGIWRDSQASYFDKLLLLFDLERIQLFHKLIKKS